MGVPLPCMCNTEFIQLVSRRLFLSFNSGGPKLRATNKIRPTNTPPAVPDFGDIKKKVVRAWDDHGNMRVGCGRCALGSLPISLRLSAVTSRAGLQPEGRHETPSFRLENRSPWHRAEWTDTCMSRTNKPLRSTRETVLRIISIEKAMS